MLRGSGLSDENAVHNSTNRDETAIQSKWEKEDASQLLRGNVQQMNETEWRTRTKEGSDWPDREECTLVGQQLPNRISTTTRACLPHPVDAIVVTKYASALPILPCFRAEQKGPSPWVA